MDVINKILCNIPLFRHCSEDEILHLQKIGSISVIKKGQLLDLKKINSYNIVIDGIFEIESLGNTNIVYLSPGSFFGNIPFTENRQSGKIKAIVDSTLLLFKVEEIYKFFIVSYKALRGYLKILSKMGFEISDAGNIYFSGSSKIISVYSPYADSGKSFFSSLLGLSLKKNGKAIILDISFGDRSIFDFFEKKVTSPLSHKKDNSPPVERIINERIEKVDDNIDLINITFGSKVKVNQEILSPLLFILSKEYKFIIMDLSDYDSELRDKAFGLSDIIFTLLKSRKNFEFLFDIFDANLKEGQRVYYIINEYYSGEVRNFRGGLLLKRYEIENNEDKYRSLEKLAEDDVLSGIVKLIIGKRRALVFETNFLESIFLSGFLAALSKTEKKFDLFYSSSFSYIVLSLYLLSENRNDFRKNILNFFSEERINKFLGITFPDEYLFKNNIISKFADELSGNNRIEMFENIPIVMLGENGVKARRIFSTGYLKDLLGASFLIYPIFEQKKFAGNFYNSGYPELKVRIEDLYRADIDEIVYISVNNRARMNYRSGRLLNFYEKYIDFIRLKHYDDKNSALADKNLVIEASEKEIRIEKILDLSEDISNKLLKEKGR